MVLERLIGQSLLRKQPDVALFIGFIFTLVAFLTSYLIFVSGMSVAMIGFSCFLIVPYVVKIMKLESSEYDSVFARKNPTIQFFSYLFIGMALAYTILFGILRPDIRDVAFHTQVCIVNRGASEGCETGFKAAGSFTLPQLFYDILFNNLTIVAVAILLSYFYGAGSVFVLNYNASIAGIVYGSLLNNLIWGNPAVWGASTVVYANPLSYLPHTVLEILGYLLAAIAGLIISKPLTRKNTPLIKRDSIFLVAVALALIVIGALVEVIVPSMF